MAESKCSPTTGSGGGGLGPKWEETSVAGKSFGYIKVVCTAHHGGGKKCLISDQLQPYSTSKPLRSSQTGLKVKAMERLRRWVWTGRLFPQHYALQSLLMPLKSS